MSKVQNPYNGGGAYEVLNHRITVDFFKNYRNTIIEFLYIYRHHQIFYLKLYITDQFYSIHRNNVQKLANNKYRHIVRPPISAKVKESGTFLATLSLHFGSFQFPILEGHALASIED